MLLKQSVRVRSAVRNYSRVRDAALTDKVAGRRDKHALDKNIDFVEASVHARRCHEDELHFDSGDCPKLVLILVLSAAEQRASIGERKVKTEAQRYLTSTIFRAPTWCGKKVSDPILTRLSVLTIQKTICVLVTVC